MTCFIEIVLKFQFLLAVLEESTIETSIIFQGHTPKTIK